MGYIYQADVYCDQCGEKIKDSLKGTDVVPEDWMDQSSYDSSDYPKDVDVEHEESDVPEHCAMCGEFLHNPLTSVGYRYVSDALKALPSLQSFKALRDGGHESLREWANWYGFTYWTAEDCQDDGRHVVPGWYSDESY